VIHARRPAPPFMKRLLDWFAATALLALVAVRIRIPDRLADRLARGAGRLVWWAIPSRRRVVLANLARAFGAERTPAERAAIGRATYAVLAEMFSDLLRLFQGRKDWFTTRMRVEGFSNLTSALEAGRGAIVVSGHYGAFPLLAAALPARGIRLHLLYRKPKSPKTRKLFDDWLALAGCEVIEDAPRHLAGVRCLKALGGGGCVCILADQHFPAGIEVPFFGAPAKTGVGAALLAARSGAPLVPLFIRRDRAGIYLLRVEPALPSPADRSREALTAATAAVTARIEAWIREAPEQWFWVHRRWKDLDRAGL